MRWKSCSIATFPAARRTSGGRSSDQSDKYTSTRPVSAAPEEAGGPAGRAPAPRLRPRCPMPARRRAAGARQRHSPAAPATRSPPHVLPGASAARRADALLRESFRRAVATPPRSHRRGRARGRRGLPTRQRTAPWHPDRCRRFRPRPAPRSRDRRQFAENPVPLGPVPRRRPIRNRCQPRKGPALRGSGAIVPRGGWLRRLARTAWAQADSHSAASAAAAGGKRQIGNGICMLIRLSLSLSAAKAKGNRFESVGQRGQNDPRNRRVARTFRSDGDSR